MRDNTHTLFTAAGILAPCGSKGIASSTSSSPRNNTSELAVTACPPIACSSEMPISKSTSPGPSSNTITVCSKVVAPMPMSTLTLRNDGPAPLATVAVPTLRVLYFWGPCLVRRRLCLNITQASAPESTVATMGTPSTPTMTRGDGVVTAPPASSACKQRPW